MITILLVSFVVFLVVGISIAFAMGLSGSLAFVLGSDLSLLFVPQQMYASLDSFSLLAVPLFVVPGQLMSTGASTEKIVTFSRLGVGHLKGGLAQANVVANMFMS